jgi:hypothetical protein
VCEASNVATGELVAIKKMDLDHQPKKLERLLNF